MMLKEGVKLKGLQPEALLGIVATKEVVEAFGVEFVITSVTDGTHMVTSLHYKGQAFDLRSRDMAKGVPEKVVAALKLALGKDFDILFEGDHIHVEFQPK